MSNKNVLFISYDGMTDPLGQSQVLPYLAGLSKLGYNITLLSCEKPDRFEKNKAIIAEIVTQNKIDWQPISFTSNPPILAKYYDLYKLKSKAVALHKQKNFALIHCRSYVSAAIGLELKQKYGVKFLFDMRGFWVDERVDGGAWKLNNPVFKFAYKHYKKKEASYIANADAIISLTEAGKVEICKWESYKNAHIEVIPCSADFDLFHLIDSESKIASRQSLAIKLGDLVISYLGSVGMWYMLEEMLEVFSLLKKKYPEAILLFITPEPAEMILSAATKFGLKETDFVIRSASRREVPQFIAASDVNIFFIKQSYSKIASSPTKLGEILAMGLPVICNSKVGDVAEIVKDADAGIVIDEFNQASYDKIVDAIPKLINKEHAVIRAKALDYYLLQNAINKYAEVYKSLIS